MKGQYLILLTALFISCSSSPKFTFNKEISSNQIQQNDSLQNFNYAQSIDSLQNYNPVPVDTIIGIASYYAHKFNGRLTANGEIYDMYGFTAAHADMPFGTIIRVVNLKNNKSIIVRVNDRMPFRPDRIIDLSYGAALELNMVNDGIQKVRLEILEWGKR
jgi:rare lipoprotein A (peptidoglycan hydrolase)